MGNVEDLKKYIIDRENITEEQYNKYINEIDDLNKAKKKNDKCDYVYTYNWRERGKLSFDFTSATVVRIHTLKNIRPRLIKDKKTGEMKNTWETSCTTVSWKNIIFLYDYIKSHSEKRLDPDSTWEYIKRTKHLDHLRCDGDSVKYGDFYNNPLRVLRCLGIIEYEYSGEHWLLDYGIVPIIEYKRNILNENE